MRDLLRRAFGFCLSSLSYIEDKICHIPDSGHLLMLHWPMLPRDGRGEVWVELACLIVEN